MYRKRLFSRSCLDLSGIVVNENKRKKICTSNKPLHLQENCFDCVKFSFVKKVEREDFCRLKRRMTSKARVAERPN